MQAMEKIKSWLGTEPSTMEDFDDAMNKVSEEISRYQEEIDSAEAELVVGVSKLNALIESNSNLTQSVLDGFANDEARLRQNIGAIKRRKENREGRLAELAAGKEHLRIAGERKLTRLEAEEGVKSLVEWVKCMKLACDCYRSAQESMRRSQGHAISSGDDSNFAGPVMLHARSLGLHELFKLFGNGLSVQSAPSATRNLDPKTYLLGVLSREFRKTGNNGNGNEEETNLGLQETQSENQNGGLS